MAKSLNDFMQKDIVRISFSEEQLNRLKYEEEQDILSAYKKLGKGTPPSQNSSTSNETDFDIDSELGLDEGNEDFGGGEGEDAGDTEIEQ